MTTPTRFVVVGAGYRARYFWDLATAIPGLECAGVIARTPRDLPVPRYASLAEAVAAAEPDFVITSLPRSVTPDFVVEAAGRGIPVLAETPPAADVASMTELWHAVGDSGLVQVAEQYPLLPSHAARLKIARSGIIGDITQAQVSSTQTYHAVALLRAFLGLGRVPVSITARAFTAPLLSPMSRERWTADNEPAPTRDTIALLDFGDGRSGLYDFTDGQTRNPLRRRRTLVRGTLGEIDTDTVVRWAGPQTVITTPIQRRQTGHDLDLDGYDTDHLTWGDNVVYRNPLFGARWNDDEIAIATIMTQMAAWVRDEGPEPYPLADGCYDHQVGLAFEVAAASDSPVEIGHAPWLE